MADKYIYKREHRMDLERYMYQGILCTYIYFLDFPIIFLY